MENRPAEDSGAALERLLDEMEAATRQLAQAGTADAAEASRALARRADAITGFALLAQVAGPAAMTERVLERLRALYSGGDEVARGIEQLRRDAAEDLGRLALTRRWVDEPEARGHLQVRG